MKSSYVACLLGLSLMTMLSGCRSKRHRSYTPQDTMTHHASKPGLQDRAIFEDTEWLQSTSIADLDEDQLVVQERSLNLKDIDEALGIDPDDPTPFFQREENIIARVYFDFDRSYIRQEDREALRAALAEIEAQGECLIVGYTDWYGTEEYNIGLGQRRADSVLEYLQDLGSRAPAEILSRGQMDATLNLSKAEAVQDRHADIVRIPRVTRPVQADSF